MNNANPYDQLRPIAELSTGTYYLFGVMHNQYFGQPPSCRPLFTDKEQAEHYKSWICPSLKPRVVKVRVTVEEVEEQ